jgi:hypothetical protein
MQNKTLAGKFLRSRIVSAFTMQAHQTVQRVRFPKSSRILLSPGRQGFQLQRFCLSRIPRVHRDPSEMRQRRRELRLRNRGLAASQVDCFLEEHPRFRKLAFQVGQYRGETGLCIKYESCRSILTDALQALESPLIKLDSPIQPGLARPQSAPAI